MGKAREFKMIFGENGIGEGNIETWGDKRPFNETILFREVLPDEITDTEMLDFFIKHKVAFEEWHGEFRIRDSWGEWLCDFQKTPREAIRAAMKVLK